MGKIYTPATAALGVEEVLRLLEGRWKLIILFHLFDGKVQRYSDLEKLIPASELCVERCHDIVEGTQPAH